MDRPVVRRQQGHDAVVIGGLRVPARPGGDVGPSASPRAGCRLGAASSGRCRHCRARRAPHGLATGPAVAEDVSGDAPRVAPVGFIARREVIRNFVPVRGKPSCPHPPVTDRPGVGRVSPPRCSVTRCRPLSTSTTSPSVCTPSDESIRRDFVIFRKIIMGAGPWVGTIFHSRPREHCRTWPIGPSTDYCLIFVIWLTSRTLVRLPTGPCCGNLSRTSMRLRLPG